MIWYTREVIYLVVGESQFRVDQALAEVSEGADEVLRYDGTALSLATLREALLGISMFAPKRVVIIDELGKQKGLWEVLPDIYQDSEQTNVVLYEPKPDKRLKTYKWLAKAARVIDCSHLPANDTRTAEKWLADYAAMHGVTLASGQVSDMVRRGIRADASSGKPIIDQQLLATAVSQLRDAGDVTTEAIDTVLAPSVYENVFNLLGTALDGKLDEVERQVASMRSSEEGYMVLGLLASQLSQLAALVLAGRDRSVDDVAKATGAHPFALRQMQKYATRLTATTIGHYIRLFAAADAQIKTSSVDPWIALDVALAKIALDNKPS